ncbi:hypothetical protein [Cellulomonas timonensis]|uniref:hypothetical protein n=1 Tax=Cellulomonas timonensis TaxID=1689271 RepID=UPI000A86186F|nr:hypothetical protein [Cellulomonas timonensis]
MPRPMRILVAMGFTVWTLLQLATMVKAALSGGSPDLAYPWFFTGVFTLILGACSWHAWTWVAESRARVLRLPALDEEPQRHHALSEQQPPPTRW